MSDPIAFTPTAGLGEPVAWRWIHKLDPMSDWTYQEQPVQSSELIIAEKLYAAPPVAPPSVPSVEDVARLVDPTAFEALDEANNSSQAIDETTRRWLRKFYAPRIEFATTQARAILSLFPIGPK